MMRSKILQSQTLIHIQQDKKIHLPKYGYPLHRPSNKYDEYIPIYHSLLYTQTPNRL